MKKFVKRVVSRSVFIRQQMEKYTGGFPKIFLYHRFAPEGASSPTRIGADLFRCHLTQIKKHFNVITIRDCLEFYHARGRWPKHCAIITVDDGYRDFYQYAYPELVRAGLRATFYVTVDFVDRGIWLWPDRLHYSIKCSQDVTLEVEMDGTVRNFPLTDGYRRSIAFKCLNNYCIKLTNDEKYRFIGLVEKRLNVFLPSRPPEDYAPVHWGELNEMASNGIEIGSHTLTHPILSRVDLSSLSDEVQGSRTVLEKRLSREVLTFCYPNGCIGDINDEVISTVISAGYIGAPFGFDLRQWEAYRMPRMGAGQDLDDFLWKLYGGELLRFPSI